MGISASIPIARRLRLRFDPIYQRIGISNSSYTFDYQSAAVNSPIGEVVSKASITANRWQVTGLIEAGFLRHLRFGIGPAVSLLTGHGTDSQACRSILRNFHIRGTSFLRFSNQVTVGAAAAMEFPFRFGNVTLAPELRYKRWFDKHFSNHMWMMDEFTVGVAIRFSRGAARPCGGHVDRMIATGEKRSFGRKTALSSISSVRCHYKFRKWTRTPFRPQ